MWCAFEWCACACIFVSGCIRCDGGNKTYFGWIFRMLFRVNRSLCDALRRFICALKHRISLCELWRMKNIWYILLLFFCECVCVFESHYYLFQFKCLHCTRWVLFSFFCAFVHFCFSSNRTYVYCTQLHKHLGLLPTFLVSAFISSSKPFSLRGWCCCLLDSTIFLYDCNGFFGYVWFA